MSEKSFKKRVSELLDNLEYDLSEKICFAGASKEYQMDLLKVMVQDAKDTIKEFREHEDITSKESVEPLTVI